MNGRVAKRIRKLVSQSDPKLFLVLRNLLGQRSTEVENLGQVYRVTKKNWRKIKDQL